MSNKILVVFITIVVAVSALVSCDGQPTPTITPLPPTQGPPATIGQPAPDFTLTNLQGQAVSLSQQKGKPVIVSFWGMGCPACLEELPYFQEAHVKYGDRLVILAVNVGQPIGLVKGLAEKNNYTFPILMDFTMQIASNWGRGFPTTYFVDSEGIVREIIDPTFESTAEIVELLDSMGVK